MVEEIGRGPGKNTFNNLSNNMAPPEPSGFTTARCEHPNAKEAEKK